MQWRMLGRRGRHASWTVVGDPAQSSWPLPAESATAREEALQGRDQNAFRLTTNYRNSREIFELAADYARAAIPGADLPTAVRETGVDPVLSEVDHGWARGSGPRRDRGADRRARGHGGRRRPGRLGGRGRRLARRRATSPGCRCSERSRPRASSSTASWSSSRTGSWPSRLSGPRTLYVVLTRATQRLHVVGTTQRLAVARLAPIDDGCAAARPVEQVLAQPGLGAHPAARGRRDHRSSGAAAPTTTCWATYPSSRGRPGRGRRFDRLVCVPFAQIRERGFEVHRDDDTALQHRDRPRDHRRRSPTSRRSRRANPCAQAGHGRVHRR